MMTRTEVIKLIVLAQNEIRESLEFSGLLPRYVQLGQDQMARPKVRDRFWGAPHWMTLSLVLSKVSVHLISFGSHEGLTPFTNTKKLLNKLENHVGKTACGTRSITFSKRLESSSLLIWAPLGWWGIQAKFRSFVNIPHFLFAGWNISFQTIIYPCPCLREFVMDRGWFCASHGEVRLVFSLIAMKG